MPELPRPGLTSVPVNAAMPDVFYGVTGFHVCGPRAVRIDMLERLADLIRVLLSWRGDPAKGASPPKGATGDGGFHATPEMMSILGCSAGELGNVLRALGFWAERRKVVPAPGDAIAPPAATPAAEANGSGAAPSPDPPSEPAGDGQASEPASDGGAAPVVTAALADAPAPCVAPAAQPAASAQDRPAGALKTAEGQWEEVWRPRRKGRAFESPSERHGQPRARPPDKAAGQEVRLKPGSPGGKPRGRRPDRRRGGDRQERSRPQLHASPPKPAFDPDSPFAALSSLKAQMEKRSQD
jgi:ATP-dependent RNA helicase SUPV3L1/SUV3